MARVAWNLAGNVHILVINSGSSSIKLSVFDGGKGADANTPPRVMFDGEISGMGGAKLRFTLRDAQGRELNSGSNKSPGESPGKSPGTDPAKPADPTELLENALRQPGMPVIDAVGYRVVHPGPHIDRHQRITPELLQELEDAVAFAPLHDPQAIALIRDMMARFPQARHYGCFDTVFHQTMPAEASTYAIPAEYRRQGAHRYGFHGLSCEAVVADLEAAASRGEAQFPRRMVIAHLGSGCSVTALLDGTSVENTMGLTPTGGVVMGTRPGDLDPGLVLYLARQHQGDPKTASGTLEAILNHQSGMVALSGLPNDMRGVRKAAAGGNADAKLAIDIFTRTVRKAIGAFAWLLGGLDAVIFTGGIGEHDVESRATILRGLEGYGVMLDTAANQSGGDDLRQVSTQDSQVAVWVVTAQEDRMIAVHVKQLELHKEES